MKRVFPILLCCVFVFPFLLIPVSAAPSPTQLDITQFGVYEDSFVYEGLLYNLSDHPSNYEPHYVLATPTFVFVVCVQLVDGNPYPESSVLNFVYDVDSTGSLICDAAYVKSRFASSDFDLVYYQFTYTGNANNPLRLVRFVDTTDGQMSSTEVIFLNYSEPDVYRFILVNRFAVYSFDTILYPEGSQDSSRSVFKASNPVVYTVANSVLDKGFSYLNDGSWDDPSLTAMAYYLNIPFGHRFTSGPSTPYLMLQTDLNTLLLVYVLGATLNYDFYLSGTDPYGDYRLTVASDRGSQFRLVYFDILYQYDEDGLPVGLPTGVQYRSSNYPYQQSLTIYTHTSSIKDLQEHFFIVSRIPVRWSYESKDGYVFWENPRGHILDPNYTPIPPLDNVLPEIDQVGGILAGVAIDDWNTNFSNLSDFVANFMSDFAPAIGALSSTISLFANLTPIQILLYISLIFGLIALIFNLGVYLVQHRGSDSKGKGKSSGKDKGD